MSITTCNVERRKTVEYVTVGMYTGEKLRRALIAEIDPCGRVLVTTREVYTSICEYCYNGQESESDHPTARGRDQIQRAAQ
jgi:hypothetical protein